MTRKEFEALVLDIYGVKPDYPFTDDLETGVFRHENGKWFAIAMNIPYNKLLFGKMGKVDVVNLKCDPEVIESMAGFEPGVFRAYHMNKTHWLTIVLDGSCDDDTIGWLLGISYELTAKRIKLINKRKDAAFLN